MTAKPPGTPSAGAYPRLTELPDPPKPPDAMQQRKHIASADQVLRSHFRISPTFRCPATAIFATTPAM